MESKHKERLDQERNYAIALNNYLSDMDRLTDPEPKSTATSSASATTTHTSDTQQEYRPRDRQFNQDRFPKFGGGGGFGGGFARGQGRFFGGQTRHMPSYRDLDAPED